MNNDDERDFEEEAYNAATMQDHQIEVSYNVQTDEIRLGCSCWWGKDVGCSPSLKKIMETAAEHLREVLNP